MSPRRLRIAALWMCLSVLLSLSFRSNVQASNGWNSIGPWGAQVNALVLAPSAPNVMYAGTDVGVFKSTNASGNWSPVSMGPEELKVSALAVDPTTATTVYAGGIGGLFKST